MATRGPAPALPGHGATSRHPLEAEARLSGIVWALIDAHCDFVPQKGSGTPGPWSDTPPRVHPAVPQGFTEPSSQWQRGTRGRREPGSPFPLRGGSRAGAARVKAPPCAVRPRLICEPPPGAGEGGQPRAGEPDASQRLEGNRRGGCSSFPMSILPQPDRHSAQTSLCPQKADPQPKSGDWGFCPHKGGDSEGMGLSSGLRVWPRVIYYRDN